MTPEEYEREALQEPDSWMDFDDEKRRFHTFAPTPASRHRDSDPLGISNYEVIKADLISKAASPDDYIDAEDGHWAVGWVQTLFVRVRDEQTGEYTPIFLAAVDWYNQLQDYPVADEEDWSQREHDDLLETLESSYSVPKDLVNEVARYLFEAHDVCRGDDMGDDRWVYDAMVAAGVDVDDMPSWLSRYAEEEPEEPKGPRPYYPGVSAVHMATMDSRTHQIVEERTIDANPCPHLILDVDHYREDGSCRCDDPDHKVMLTWGYKWRDGRWKGAGE